jgi:urease accessory protein
MSQSHSHDGATHSHDGGFNAQEHGHSHEILDGPGSYLGREMPIIEGRDWSERAFTIGIGGFVYTTHPSPRTTPHQKQS